MTWKCTKDKERFFEELDRAFNTPSSQALVLPQIQQHKNTPKPLAPSTCPSSGPKRHVSTSEVNDAKRRRISANNTSTTGVGIRRVHEKPKSVKRRSTVKRRSSETSQQSSIDETKPPGLLSGMVLFFIPNSKKNGVRRYRMTLFAQHGADVRDVWSDDITHIICDKSITGERILRDLRWEQFPLGIVIVNELWIPQCLAARRMVDISKERFRVAGIQSQTTNESGNSVEIVVNPPKNGSLQVKSNILKRIQQNTASPEHSGILDIQDFAFGRSSPPVPAVLERQTLDNNSLSLSTSPQENRRLDDAIDEVRKISNVSNFPEETTSLVNSDMEHSDNETSTAADIPAWQKKFQCMQPHDGTEGLDNPNSKTIEILQKMQAHYERTMDEWRAMSYRKAISILKKTKRYIHTEDQAREIPGIGERLAKKIVEIAATGKLQRLQNLDASDRTVELFMGVYGIGRSRALQFVMQGFRTLKDLLERGELNQGQRIGVELYEDFSQRIPREEVAIHSTIVKEAAHKLDPTLQIFTMGSYRRGAETCGDIDLLITKPSATAADLMAVMVPLVETLVKSKFLTHALATSHSDDGSKWHGVSRLPNGIHRRLDLLFVPWKERGAALIYFTGNDIFNRSLRLLASKKGMGLNQRGLFEDTLRGPGRVKIARGTCIASESEEEIFKILGVPWRPPELRNC